MTLIESASKSSVGVRPAGAPLPAIHLPAKSRLPVIIGAAVLAAAIVGGAIYYNGRAARDTSVLTYPVSIESFDIRIPLNGEMKASRNLEIRSQVQGQTTVVSLVAEGARVAQGDVLVTLASDALKDKLEDSRIRLDTAIAATVNAEESVHIQEMQNDSDIKTGETAARIATLEFEQFIKGDAKVQVDTFTTALENAKTDLERKTKELALTKQLAAQQFVSDNDVLDAVIAERDSENKLNTAQMNLEVWEKYAEPTKRQTLDSKREAAASELDRTKAKASSQLLLKQADLRAKQSSQHVEESRYKALQDQLAACTIKAPQAGMVVYESSVGNGYYGDGPLQQGATVRENQTLIELPDTSKMLVEVRLPEQMTDKVKSGQEAVITVDAAPGKVFHGKVDTIGVLPDSSQRWSNPNLKEYRATIALDSTDSTELTFKPGMSSKVEILVQRLENIVAVPLQAVFVSGGQSYVWVGDAGHYERRNVAIGQTNTTRAEVRSGLKAGEVVLLSRPKDAPADVQRAPDPAQTQKANPDAKTEKSAAAAAGLRTGA